MSIDPSAMVMGLYLFDSSTSRGHPSCSFAPWSIIVESWSKCDTWYSHPAVDSVTLKGGASPGVHWT